ncbi:hypothetical protein EON67_01990 [archaeon]|nr:MAG: hypothetical protein EON67_01990 [archaeon]
MLAALDANLNLAMEQTEEWTDGVLTDRFGDAFIRGNNGTCAARHARVHAYCSVLCAADVKYTACPLRCLLSSPHAVLYISAQGKRT